MIALSVIDPQMLTQMLIITNFLELIFLRILESQIWYGMDLRQTTLP